jgi:hypothetical protein
MERSAEELAHQHIIETLVEIAGLDKECLSPRTALVGSRAVIRSRELVELLLELEEFCECELGVEFDWTSDGAMSERRSPLRTIGTLAEHVAGLRRQVS